MIFRTKPKYLWTHFCKKVPGACFGRPTEIEHGDLDRCIYCGEISPRKQAAADAEAAAVLVATKPEKEISR